ncbi:hypothetical protein ORIO_20510 (plasmid) [Cereibacter azotoformans]|uniref:Uncharacterized protein n=1 Tax=Cereibacter sphaeroides (strain ATCC 17025 / ATH 2.4.3) TaxID=349102 RepID=A4X036_CERS5|nr:hypothetical protein [Cereibacter azotoformans]AXQ96081.1 hypothetical protein D0Z66_20360 [Cereibacter sphaeroides]UIJ32919.1 hypothetical protein LV780_20305 [Cereibacter azotoformans]ULB12184.1 hypothetical protein ORIO_20510 [Cereibacter azotoformans]
MLAAILSGGLIGYGLARSADWAWKAGLAGIVVSVLLGFLLTRSLEKRLWALFFAFMAGAAGSLAAPVYSFAIVGQIGNPTTGTGVAGDGTLSSGGSILGTVMWFAGALIAARLAYLERRR